MLNFKWLIIQLAWLLLAYILEVHVWAPAAGHAWGAVSRTRHWIVYTLLCIPAFVTFWRQNSTAAVMLGILAKAGVVTA